MAREMKDSGIEWIGEIPEGWETPRLKSLFAFGKGLPITKENLTETGVPVISYGQIHAKFNTGVQIQEDLLRFVSPAYLETNPESLVQVGDLIMADTSEDLDGCGNSAYVDREMTLFAGYHTIILKANSRKNNKFIAYLMKTDPWRSQLRSRVSGVKVYSISRKILSEVVVINPPLDEQRRITDFLDHKCALIDDVIEKTHASIEEYKKLKQAMITKAVTKGIRPGRKMKASGIEWLGEIPEDWSVLKLRFLCDMQAGKNLTSESIAPEGEFPVYGGNGLRGFYSEFNTEGDFLLVGRQGALCGNVHRVSGRFWATEHAVITSPSALSDLGFLYYLLIGMNLNQYVNNTAAQPGLAVSQIQRVRTCFVPLEEQREIARYLDEKCRAIDALIDQKTALITELGAYKKSLIYEYVTGKKEVSAAV